MVVSWMCFHEDKKAINQPQSGCLVECGGLSPWATRLPCAQLVGMYNNKPHPIKVHLHLSLFPLKYDGRQCLGRILDILVFPSPTNYMLTSFGFSLLVGDIIPRFLQND